MRCRRRSGPARADAVANRWRPVRRPTAGLRRRSRSTRRECAAHASSRCGRMLPSRRAPARRAANARRARRRAAGPARCAPRTRASSASTAAASPDTTTLSAALIAAMAKPIGHRRDRGLQLRRRARRSPPWSRPAAAPASAGRAPAIKRSPSSSVKTPATQAATYSPTEWPMTAAGSMPHERHSCVSAVLDGEKRRLRPRRSHGSAHSRPGPACSTRLQRSPSRVRPKQGIAAIDDLAEDRRAFVNAGSCPGIARLGRCRGTRPPAACPGSAVPRCTAGCVLPSREARVSAARAVAALSATMASAFREMRAPHACRVRGVRQRQSASRGERIGVALRRVRAAPSRCVPTMAGNAAAESPFVQAALASGRFLDDDVRVGAAEPEGAHSGNAAPSAPRGHARPSAVTSTG